MCIEKEGIASGNLQREEWRCQKVLRSINILLGSIKIEHLAAASVEITLLSDNVVEHVVRGKLPCFFWGSSDLKYTTSWCFGEAAGGGNTPT